MNALGYHDLESLEDFIIKNGAAALVPLSSLRPPPRLQGLTDSMGQPIQPQIHASLNESVARDFGAGDMTKAETENLSGDDANMRKASTQGEDGIGEERPILLDHVAQAQKESVPSSAGEQEVTSTLPSNL